MKLNPIPSLKSLFRAAPSEQKSYSPYYPLLFGDNGLFNFASTNVQWMQYYNTVAPVGDAVDKIANSGSVVDILLFAAAKNEAKLPVREQPFLKLLRKPNPYQTQQTFIKEALVHERVTGNNYVYLVGGVSAGKDKFNSEPLEIYNLRPDLVNATPSSVDGRAAYYQTSQYGGKMLTFNRAEMRNVHGRLIDTYIESNGYGQLYHFKNISTQYSGTNYQLFGNAPLTSCELQIGQFFEAAVYNYFLIKNGLSAKNMISPDVKEPISQDTLNKLRAFITQEFSGAGNSGKTIVSTLPLKSSSLSVNIKDMDFKSMNTQTEQTVYKKLEIPLPLVDNEHTALNNMESSDLMFYDKAVLPTLSTFCNNLFTFPFNDRYKDSKEFLQLGYNEFSIPALLPRLSKNVEMMKKAGTASYNEIREYQGLGRIESEGCDQVYIQNNQVPIGKDTNLIDTLGIDQEKDKQILLEIMRKQKLVHERS